MCQEMCNHKMFATIGTTWWNKGIEDGGMLVKQCFSMEKH